MPQTLLRKGSAPIGYLSHRTRGRARIKLPARRGDVAFFDETLSLLADCPGVEDVSVNAMTASILVLHRGEFSLIADFAARHSLFRLERLVPSGPSLSRELLEKVRAADRLVRRESEGGLDLGALTFVGMLGFSAFQIARGNVAAPAVTLLWYAVNALSMQATADRVVRGEPKEEEKELKSVARRAGKVRRATD